MLYMLRTSGMLYRPEKEGLYYAEILQKINAVEMIHCLCQSHALVHFLSQPLIYEYALNRVELRFTENLEQIEEEAFLQKTIRPFLPASYNIPSPQKGEASHNNSS